MADDRHPAYPFVQIGKLRPQLRLRPRYADTAICSTSNPSGCQDRVSGTWVALLTSWVVKVLPYIHSVANPFPRHLFRMTAKLERWGQNKKKLPNQGGGKHELNSLVSYKVPVLWRQLPKLPLSPPLPRS